jgi:hypothetical protein
MSTRTIRTSIGGALSTQLGKTSNDIPAAFSIGKVYGIIMDESTPSPYQFNNHGGWGGLGTIFYMDYPVSKDIKIISTIDCKTAKPFFPNQKYFPLVEELVVLFELPSFNTQENPLSTDIYYISVINLWNNNHHNSQPTKQLNLGNTFTENERVKTLLPFEGDHIIEGRTGNSLRFSSTTKYNNKENWWSITGGNGDPITLLTNGHDFSFNNGKPYIEDVNLDSSALYLTSTQKVPIDVRKFKNNPVFNPFDAHLYSGAQAVLVGDRIIINAKYDEVLIYGRGIGFSSPNTIYLNSDKEILLEAPKIHLGLVKEKLPTETILLGHETINMLSTLIKELKNLGTSLSSVAATPSGTPIVQLNQAGVELFTALENLTTMTNNLKKLKSTKSYTA